MAQNQSSIYINAKSNVAQVAKSIRSSLSGINGALNSLGAATSKIVGVGAALAGVGVSFATIKSLYADGIKVNIETSQAKNGMAGIIASLYEIKDVNGEVLQGQEKFNSAVMVSSAMIKKLRVDALRTGASFADLRDSFQSIIGPASASGMDLDQARVINTLIANGAKAMGMNNQQIAQESRAIFSGQITGDAQLGTALQIGPGGALQQAYKEAMKTGTAYEFLYKQLNQFENAGVSQAMTLGGSLDALGDVKDLFTGEATKSLETSLSRIGTTVGDFVTDAGEINKAYQGIIDFAGALGGSVGSSIADLFNDAVEGAKDFGNYIAEDQSSLNKLSDIATNVSSIFSGLWEVVKSVGGGFLELISYFARAGDETADLSKDASAWFTILDSAQRMSIKVNVLALGISQAFGLIFDVITTNLFTLKKEMSDFWDVMALSVSEMVGTFDKTTGDYMKDKALVSLQLTQEEFDKNKLTLKLSPEIVADTNAIDNLWADILSNMATKEGQLEGKFNITNNPENKTNAWFQKELEARNEREAMQAIEEYKASQLKLTNTNGKGATDASATGSGVDKDKFLYKQQIDELKANAEFQKSIYDDLNRNLDLDYAHNLVSVKDYYAKKNSVDKKFQEEQLKTIDAEILLTKARLEAQETTPAPTDSKNQGRADEKRLKDITEVQKNLNSLLNERSKLESEMAFNNRKNTFDQIDALRKYGDEIQDLNDKLQNVLGNSRQGRDTDLDRRFRDEQEKYQTDPAAKDASQRLYEAEKNQNKYNDSVERYNNLINTQSTYEDRLQILTDNGNISELDQMLQLKGSRKDYIRTLEEQLAIQEKINEGSTDPQVINALGQAKNKILELKLTADPLANSIDKLFNSGLNDGLSDFIDGTKTAKEAFTDFIGGIEKELLRLANQEVIKQLTKSLFGTDAQGNASNTFGGVISGLFGGGKTAPKTGDQSSAGLFSTIGSWFGGTDSGGGGSSSGGLFSTIASAFGSYFGGGFATGGSVSKNKAYLVGENGPELFIPRGQGGNILNNGVTAGLGGSGGNIVQNINVNTPNYTSFRNSDGQIGAQMLTSLKRAQRYT